ncbi:MAG: hypothetical protein J0I07_33840 [Myxococcales bacterium]|nr:hypothetical protein [Myxococcales bacterium]
MSMLPRARRHGLPAVALALVVVIAALVTRVSEGRRAVEGCDAALARQDYVEAIVLARAAAEARCPWCEAPELGFARLFAIAKDAESRGDHPTAVAAWRAVRAATLATSVIDRSPARRERADGEIARLEHRIDAATAGSAPSPAASEERLRAALATSLVPSGIVFALLAIGGALFVIGAVRFVRARTFRVPDLVVAVAGGALAAAAVLVF